MIHKSFHNSKTNKKQVRKSRKKSAVHHETKHFFCNNLLSFISACKREKKKRKNYFSNQKFEFLACNIKNWKTLKHETGLPDVLGHWYASVRGASNTVMQNALSTQKCYCLYLAMSIYRTSFEVMSHWMGRRSTIKCCEHKKCISRPEIRYRLMKSNL